MQYYDTDMEILHFDTNICTSKEARDVACEHLWKAASFLLSTYTWSNLRHLERSGEKVLLLYFRQGCTVQSHSHFQSPRLNPLAGEGVCLRIALTAGACLSVLAMPSKGILADLHSGFLLKKKNSRLSLTPSFNLFFLSTFNAALFCWQTGRVHAKCFWV